MIDRNFFKRAHLPPKYRDVLDRVARERAAPAGVPDDRLGFARLVWEAVLREPTKAAILLVAASDDEPTLAMIRAACRRSKASLVAVAPAFGWLPIDGNLRRWTNTADPDAEPGRLLAGVTEHAASFTLWRALGGVPNAGVTWGDRLHDIEDQTVFPITNSI
ncbi:MAG: hypothetical protein RIB60_01820 [Phycisphaerales bacterium]